jgi:hypothetical protein
MNFIFAAIASSAVTATPNWAPSSAFTLTCTGTQTAYQEGDAGKQTIPWQETFTVDLAKGNYCAQSCGRKFQFNALKQDELDLDNTTSASGSSLKRYHPSSRTMETNTIRGASKIDRLHIEQSGTCKIAAKPSQ